MNNKKWGNRWKPFLSSKVVYPLHMPLELLLYGGADFCIPTLPSDLDNIPSRNMLKKYPKWPCNLRDHPRILQVCHTHSYLNYQSSTSCHLLGLFRALPSSLKINEDRDSQLRKSESSLADLLPEPLPSSKAAIPLKRFTKPQEHTSLWSIFPLKIISQLESL
jgi:hypothetical protein